MKALDPSRPEFAAAAQPSTEETARGGERRVTRRRFIGIAAAASAGTVLSVPRWASGADRRKRVVIIGGRLAALSAAYELQKMKVGAEIVILEAQGAWAAECSPSVRI